MRARARVAWRFAAAAAFGATAALAVIQGRGAPQDAALRALLAQVLAATGALDEAITEQQQSLKLKPDDADQWNNLGVMEARKGDRMQARSDFHHALELQPSNADAQANLQRLEPTAGAALPR